MKEFKEIVANESVRPRSHRSSWSFNGFVPFQNGIELKMPEGDLTKSSPNKKDIFLTGSIIGPPDTPYAGAKFNVDIVVVGESIGRW